MVHSQSTDFDRRLSRLRANDPAAIEEFVAEYEPFIRRSLRFRIARAALRPAADSVDICQSVLASFLLRLTAGDYELENDIDLRKLLVVIANNKFLQLKRHETAAKRDRGLTLSINDLPELSNGDAGDATRDVKYSDLLMQVKARMSPREHELFRLRSEGKDWESIGILLREPAILLRKRLSRAIHRIAFEIGLEEGE